MSDQIARRTLLAGLGIGAMGGAALGGAALSAPNLRVRREISDLEKSYPGELDRYRRGVAEMLKSKAGSVAWEQNAIVHAKRCGVVSGEIHGTWFFLPWHRAFLWATELNLQHAIGDDKVALPYWHWPVLSAVPPSFQTGALDHPRGRQTVSPYEYAFESGMKPDRFIGEYKVVLGRPEATRIGFGGYAATPLISSSLEGTPHGSVHNGVGTGGKDMGNIKWSPRDPIFYGHHGNLDRLWEVWRGAPGSANRATEPWTNKAFADQMYEYFDLSTGATRAVRIAEIKETADLGYRYALPGEGPGGGPLSPVDSGSPQSGPAAPDPGLLGAPVARGEATISSPPLAVSGATPPKTRAILTVQGVQVPPERGVTVAIYLVDRTRKGFSPTEAVFVGVVGLVRQSTVNQVTLALDITDLMARTRIDEGKIGVVVVPVGEMNPPPLKVAGYKINVVPE